MKTKEQKFKILTTSKDKKHEQAQFEFALLCAERTLDEDTPQELVDYFMLVAILRNSKDFRAIGRLKDKEYRTIDSVAYRASTSDAYRASTSDDYRASTSDAYWSAFYASSSDADWSASWSGAFAHGNNWAAGRKAQFEIAAHVWEKWRLK